jgi:hypothetical protein
VATIYVPPALTISNTAFCICGFRTILRENSDHFLKQHFPANLCNGEVLCFLCGTDWILKYYLDELLFSRRTSGHCLGTRQHPPPPPFNVVSLPTLTLFLSLIHSASKGAVVLAELFRPMLLSTKLRHSSTGQNN